MIIQSILDNDLYKFTMQQAVLKLGFSATPVVYKFNCRTDNINFTPYYDRICEEIKSLKNLYLQEDEIEYLKGIRFLSEEYITILKSFRFDPSLVDIKLNGPELDIRVEGPWFSTILFEIPILSIISEIYTTSQPTYSQQLSIVNTLDKCRIIDGIYNFEFTEGGTRRRSSSYNQDTIISIFKNKIPDNFKGTSNVYFAMKHDIPCFGTMAHEWLQAHQQLGYRVADSQKMAFENWIKVYRGDLGIALSDVINTDAFLKDFDDPLFYKLFDGVREDSEPDPLKFAHRIINFYLTNKIDPHTKKIVFSNSLNFEKAVKLYENLKNLIKPSFLIGTYLMNDAGVKPLNIVMKMVECNGQPVAKISNSPGKGMCESPEYVSYLKSVYGIEH